MPTIVTDRTVAADPAVAAQPGDEASLFAVRVWPVTFGGIDECIPYAADVAGLCALSGSGTGTRTSTTAPGRRRLSEPQIRLWRLSIASRSHGGYRALEVILMGSYYRGNRSWTSICALGHFPWRDVITAEV